MEWSSHWPPIEGMSAAGGCLGNTALRVLKADDKHFLDMLDTELLVLFYCSCFVFLSFHYGLLIASLNKRALETLFLTGNYS